LLAIFAILVGTAWGVIWLCFLDEKNEEDIW